jgi:hypothetical protein
MRSLCDGYDNDEDYDDGDGNDDNNSIQFIYLRARQQPDKDNYSQALKQQFSNNNNIIGPLLNKIK